MASKAKAKAVAVKPPERTPRDVLVRAALDYYRWVKATKFREGRMGPIPAGEQADWKGAWDALSKAGEILHHAVIAVLGGAVLSVASGTTALVVDGALIVIDEADGIEDGEKVHVVEPADVIAVA